MPSRGTPRRAGRRRDAAAASRATSRIRGRAPPRERCSASSSSAPIAAGVDCLRTTDDGPSTRLRRSSPSRAGTGPQAPLSSRWTKPRTIRTPSSNASHGFRSRHCAVPGTLTCPFAMRIGASRPGDVARRLAGASAWSSASRSAASIGAARRSSSIRSRIAPNADSWRGVWRPSSSAAGPRRPRAPGTGRASAPRSSRPSGSRARATSCASSGAWRCSPPPSWSRQIGQR